MTTDAELRANLMERLDAIPAVGESEIDVFVDNGLVTLSGEVDTHQTRFQIEKTVRRIPGVRGLAMHITPGQTASRKHHH